MLMRIVGVPHLLLGAIAAITCMASPQMTLALESALFCNDPKLEAAAVSHPAHILLGHVGDHVGKIQQALTELDGAVIDSVESQSKRYGPSTAQAVLAYKKRYNILGPGHTVPDNIVGILTMKHMDKQLSITQPCNQSPGLSSIPGNPIISREPLDIRLRVFIPSPAVLVALPGAGDYGYKGDNRGFSYDTGTSRAEIWIDVSASSEGTRVISEKKRSFGQTESYRADDLESVIGKPNWWKRIKRDPFLKLERPPVDIKTAEVDANTLTVTARAERSALTLFQTTHVLLHVDAANPLVPVAPAINADLDLQLIPSTPGGISYSISGTHDGFPAYELYIRKHRVYSYDPVQVGADPTRLGLPPIITVEVPWTVLMD